VVLIDFWTYSCINCIRTLPHLERWDKEYRDKGLTIIGVHTPEFELENPPFIDEDLLQYEEIWAAAGTPNAVFCLSPSDLVKITEGLIINLKDLNH